MMDCKSVSDRGYVRIGCVIMASGYGRRFGGNKLLADFCGKPLLQWLLDATRGVFDDCVVITRYPEIEKICQEQNILVVLHDLPNRNDTVKLGLEAIGNNIDYCMFCPGDQPLLSRKTIQKMVNLVRQENYAGDFLRLSYRTRVGTPVIFPKKYFEELASLSEGKGGSALLKKYPEKVCLFPAGNEFELLDVDCPTDLERLKKHHLRFCQKS